MSDQEEPEDGNTMDVTEAADDNEDITPAPSAVRGRTYAVDLWLTSKSWDHYAAVVREVFKGDQLRWIAVSTRSAHPSIFIACQQRVGLVIGMVQGPKEFRGCKIRVGRGLGFSSLGFRVYLLCRRVDKASSSQPRHSMAHGRELLENMAVSMKMTEAMRLTNQKRRLTEDGLQFVSVTNPESDPDLSVVKLQEVPVLADTNNSWRVGVLADVAVPFSRFCFYLCY
jgi:hypothetical protein